MIPTISRVHARTTPDRHELHRQVAALDMPGRVLWSRPTADLLIIQGPRAVPARHWQDAQVMSAPVRLDWTAGLPVRLALIANPVRATARPGQRGVRTPLPVGEHVAWAERKLGTAVRLDELAAQPLGTHVGRRTDRMTAHALTAYHALGTVIDPAALAALITDGVGPGKAYGAGLLIVQEES